MPHHPARASGAFPLSPDDSLWRLIWKESIFRTISSLPGIAFTRTYF